MLLYKQLVKRKKLIKFCFLFCGEYKKAFKINFLLCESIYKKKCISNYKFLSLSVKRILPLFYNLPKCKGNFLFLATKNLYVKTFNTNKYNMFAKKLLAKKQGLFFNFSIPSTKIVGRWDFVKNPAMLIFFNFEESKHLLYESKLKNIPAVGLVTVSDNSTLIEYPILVNNFYFHTTYFFCQLFFKLLITSWSKRKKFNKTPRLVKAAQQKKKRVNNKKRQKFSKKSRQ